jgi:outer membrane murein-binding lipoprotein Lpp
MNTSTLLISTALLTSLLLNGCGSEVSAKMNVNTAKTEYLSTFLDLHKDYCEKKFDNQDSLKSALSEDKRFNLAEGFDGVYETHINKISFAVSPETDGCTTDVMIKNRIAGGVMFNFEDINKALIAKGYKDTGKMAKRKDVGTDQSEVTIIEKTYLSPEGEVTTLDFPIDKQDKYYMTLFAEKFSKVEKESKPRSSLKMATI